MVWFWVAYLTRVQINMNRIRRRWVGGLEIGLSDNVIYERSLVTLNAN